MALLYFQELSPLLPKALAMSIADEESMDCASVDQSFDGYQGDGTPDNTPSSAKKQKVIRPLVSGVL